MYKQHCLAGRRGGGGGVQKNASMQPQKGESVRKLLTEIVVTLFWIACCRSTALYKSVCHLLQVGW